MDKKKEIMSAALQLFVSEGFHGTSTAKIAKAARVSNGTFFHYFKTKDELIIELYVSLKEELNAVIFNEVIRATTYEEKFRANFRSALLWALKNKNAYFFILQMLFSPHIGLIPEAIKKQQSKMHEDILSDAIKAGVFKSIPPGLIASIKSSHTNGAFMYLLEEPHMNEDELLKAIDEAFGIMWNVLAAH